MYILKPSKYLLLSLGFGIFSNGCHTSTTSSEAVKKIPFDKESSIQNNKKAIEKETNGIAAFIKQKKWKMEQTGTGLYYIMNHQGRGKRAHNGMVAKIDYVVTLLNGDTLYTSKKNGAKEFELGKGSVESGLEEGVLLMKEGDQATFIIPSYLGYGIAGDLDKIPPRTPLIYDVKLLEIK